MQWVNFFAWGQAFRTPGTRPDLSHAQNLHGDIVWPTAFAGEVDQGTTSGSRGILKHGSLQFLIADLTPEAIGAEHQVVAFF